MEECARGATSRRTLIERFYSRSSRFILSIYLSFSYLPSLSLSLSPPLVSSRDPRAITILGKLPCITRGSSAKENSISTLTCYTHAARRPATVTAGYRETFAHVHVRTYVPSYGHAREHVNGTCHRWFFESHLSTKAARLSFPFTRTGWPRARSRNLYLPTYTYVYQHDRAESRRQRENWNYLTRHAVQTNRRCRS